MVLRVPAGEVPLARRAPHAPGVHQAVLVQQRPQLRRPHRAAAAGPAKLLRPPSDLVLPVQHAVKIAAHDHQRRWVLRQDGRQLPREESRTLAGLRRGVDVDDRHSRAANGQVDPYDPAGHRRRRAVRQGAQEAAPVAPGQGQAPPAVRRARRGVAAARPETCAAAAPAAALQGVARNMGLLHQHHAGRRLLEKL